MASKSKFDDLDLTKDEIHKIAEALKKEEFRKLLVEYAEEISDPENKRRYEEEIAQMENERGMDVKFVNPEPGYVIKTTVDGDTKAFINICKNEHIGKPSSQRKTDPSGKSGLQWSIPHSFSSPKEDVDKKGEKCKVFDVVFNPDTYRMSESNARFKEMLNDTAIDGIERQFGVKIDRKNLKFPSIKFKGVPQATVIRTRKSESEQTNPEENRSSEKSVLDNFPYPYDNLTSEEKAKQKEKEIAERDAKKPKKEKAKEKDDDFTTPKYSITHRSEFDLQDARNAPDAKPSTRPTSLIISIQLPLLKSAKTVNLDIFEKRLILESKTPAAYRLDINLPYPVDEDNGSAKFDKAKHCLTVTLPVLPAVIPPINGVNGHSAVEEIIDEKKAEESISTNYSSQNGEEPPKPLIETINLEDTTAKITDVAQSNKSPLNGEANKDIWLNNEYDKPETKNVLYSFPSYDYHQDVSTVSITMHVANVSKETVSKSFPNESACHIKFVSLGSGHFPLHFSFFIQFSADFQIVNSECSVDVSGQNVVLVMTKKAGCCTLWDQLSVGVDADHLEEKLFLTETNLDAEFDNLEAELEKMPLNFEDPLLSVTEMNEDNLTIKVKYEDTLSTEEELSPRDEELSSSFIEVVHNKETPKLKGIMKQRSRTISESSDEACVHYSRENSSTSSYNSSESPISETDEFTENGLKKSVSFSEQVDKTMFKGNTSVTTLRATLKNKRRKAKKREVKYASKEARRQRRTSGSASSGDEHSGSQLSHDDEDQEHHGDHEDGHDGVSDEGHGDLEDDSAFHDKCSEPTELSQTQSHVSTEHNAHSKSKNKKRNKKKSKKIHFAVDDSERTDVSKEIESVQQDVSVSGKVDVTPNVQDQSVSLSSDIGAGGQPSVDTNVEGESIECAKPVMNGETIKQSDDSSKQEKTETIDSDDGEEGEESESKSAVSWKDASAPAKTEAAKFSFKYENSMMFELDEE